jgi:outer membrane biosynthesis protein TonB
MKKFWMLLLASFCTALLVACSQAAESPTPTAESIAVVSTNTPEPREPSPTLEPAESTATVTAAPAATKVPTLEPTTPPEEVASEDNDCLACHIDKDRLIDTTAPVEVAPSESSGVG